MTYIVPVSSDDRGNVICDCGSSATLEDLDADVGMGFYCEDDVPDGARRYCRGCLTATLNGKPIHEVGCEYGNVDLTTGRINAAT